MTHISISRLLFLMVGGVCLLGVISLVLALLHRR